MSDTEIVADRTTEGCLSNSIFYMAMGFRISKKGVMKTISELTDSVPHIPFSFVSIYTGVNRSSVLSENQYRYYCSEFGLRTSVCLTYSRTFRGIGGSTATIYMVIIPIPFSGLTLIIDVEFLVHRENSPTLLGLNYMVCNSL